VDTTKNSDDYFTAEELHEWISIMNEEKFTELAFRVLVEMNVDINILEKELSHIFYVQLMCGSITPTTRVGACSTQKGSNRLIDNSPTWIACSVQVFQPNIARSIKVSI